MKKKNFRLLIAGIGLVAAMFSTSNVAMAQLKEGTIVDSGVFENAIPWDPGKQNYNALIELIQTPENKNPNTCDLLRISFTRSLISSDKDTEGNSRKFRYKQKWALDCADTLVVVTENSKYEVYVDGEHVRDSIVASNEYRVKGAILGTFYDYTTLDNTPMTDKKVDYNFEENSYMPVTKEFFDFLKSLSDEWIVEHKETEEWDPFNFNSIHLAGPTKEFSLNGNVKMIVGKDYMTVNVYSGNKIIDSVTFKKSDGPIRSIDTDSQKATWVVIYPDSQKSHWSLKYKENQIVLYTNGEKRYTIDKHEMGKAINLASKRGIITDPPSMYDLYDWWL